jgi:hypothetical protein
VNLHLRDPARNDNRIEHWTQKRLTRDFRLRWDEVVG